VGGQGAGRLDRRRDRRPDATRMTTRRRVRVRFWQFADFRFRPILLKNSKMPGSEFFTEIHLPQRLGSIRMHGAIGRPMLRFE
jgi:hypothetical protein